jgi:hypothetical protein
LTVSWCKVWHKTASVELHLAKTSAQSFMSNVLS